MISHTTGPHLPTLTMAAQKNWKNMGMLASVADCGRSRKWGCRRRLVLGFKPGNATMTGEHSLGSPKARCSSNAELSLSNLEECRRDAAGRKGVKGLLLVGHKKVPYGLRTGDPSNTADGARN